MPSHAELEQRLAAVVLAASGGAWLVTRAWREPRRLCMALDAGGDGGLPLALQIEAWLPRGAEPAYRVERGVAFRYRLDGRTLAPSQQRRLDRVVAALARVLPRSLFDEPRAPSVGAPEAPTHEFPTPYQRAHLESETTLPRGAFEAFQRDGHVLVRRAIHRDVVLAARPPLLAAVERGWPKDLPPVAERPDAYSRSFTQLTDLGVDDPVVRVFSQARRVLRMAADLMGVRAVRFFCEDWLVKEPGARITPWHQDEAVFPFDAVATVTCWIPLQDVRRGDGLLRFARGSHRMGLAPIEDINDVSEAAFARIIADHGFAIDELPPIFMGDVSFHHGRTIHGAFPNDGAEPRLALALHCFADGAVFKAPTTPKMALLSKTAAPGRAPGEPAVSDRWPLVYDASAPAPFVEARAGLAQRFHLRANLLPGDEALVDVWVADGRLRFSTVEGAVDLAPEGGFVTSGLVDCHSHISYPHDAGEPVGTEAWMNARRAEHAATGVLLLRDMGAVDDAISSLLDAPGLPRVHATGTMILRHEEFPFTPTEPAQLVRAAAERIERGARWTKVFADWSHDYRGRVNSGFTERDEVTYPVDRLAEAVREVHALGGRVGAHAFTRSGAEVAIRAGVDSLEHGWGVDEDLVREMADRGVAWVPLVGIAPAMWRVAQRDGETDRMEWIARTMRSLERLLPLARARGVRLFAGSDMFPEVTVGDEIAQLAELGLDRAAALAAGSWSARDWLGEAGLVEGAPADLVLYRADPRIDLSVLVRPELIMIGGARVAPSMAHVRPRHATWAEHGAGVR